MDEKVISGETDEEYKEYRRAKRMEEAKANVAKVECDCLSVMTDKISMRDACKEANKLALGALVVHPFFVKACASFLGGDPQCSLIAAISYPYGGETTETKVAAVKRAIKDGVDETEVCAPMAMIRDGNWQYYKRECKKLRKASRNRAVRIVIDCTVVNEKELIKACTVAGDAGINCVRLNGASGDLLSTVKTALKGKCLIKASVADNAAAFYNFCTMGADYVSCTNAFNLANYLMKQAEEG